MKKILVVILFVVVSALAAAWWVLPRTQRFYTDAETIRRPVEADEPRNVLWQPPVPVENGINSCDDDYEPRVSADGANMYFVRGRAGRNAELVVANRVPGGWAEPVELSGINTEYDELGPEPSSDGLSLFFYSDRPGGAGGYDLWLSRRRADVWGPPENLGLNVNTGFNEYGPAITPDGAALYFASNRPRGHDQRVSDPDAWRATVREDLFQRDYDLYLSSAVPGGFGASIAVTELNTPFNDGAPAVSAFGDFLYFCSDRPGGIGAFDLYRSRRVRNAHQVPANLGEPVNTTANELDPGLAVGGYGIYFSSDRGARTSGVTSDLRAFPTDAPSVGDYDLYYAVSREVFVEQDVLHRQVDWAGLWKAVGPNLLWALLALLTLLALLPFVRGAAGRRLSLLAKCLIASMIMHLLLMLAFNSWEVTAGLIGVLRHKGGTRVALTTSAGVTQLTSQIRGVLLEMDSPASAEIATPRCAPGVELIADYSPASLAVERSRSEEAIRETIGATTSVAEASPSPGEFNSVGPRLSDWTDLHSASYPTSSVMLPPTPDQGTASEEKQSTAPCAPTVVESESRASVEDLVVNATILDRVRQFQPDAGSASESNRRDDSFSASNVMRDTAEAPIVEWKAVTGLSGVDLAVRELPAAEYSLPVDSLPLAAAMSAQEPDGQSVNSGLPSTPRASEALEPSVWMVATRLSSVAPAESPVAPAHSLLADSLGSHVNDSRPADGQEIVPSVAAMRGAEVAAPRLNLPAMEVSIGAAPFEIKDAPVPIDLSVVQSSRSNEPAIANVGRLDARRPLQFAVEVADSPARSEVGLTIGDPSSVGAIHDSTVTHATGAFQMAPGAGAAAWAIPDSVLRVAPASTESAGFRIPDEVALPSPPGTASFVGPSTGTISGVVTDSATNKPVADAVIRLDLQDESQVTAVSDTNGAYMLAVPQLPDNFAVSASLDGYIPQSANVSSSRVEGSDTELDFALHRERTDVVPVEAVPDVHHLGNDHFEGRINSQFQKESEGDMFEAEFVLKTDQLTPGSDDARLRLMARGVQCPHKIRINGTRIPARLDESPRNGSFGEFEATFDASLLIDGVNTIRIEAVRCNGDLDDFEFVNVQIHLE